MDIRDFEDIVAEMEFARQDLEFSQKIQSNLLIDVAEVTFKSILNQELVPKAEDLLSKLELIDMIVDECQADLNYFVSLLSENPN